MNADIRIRISLTVRTRSEDRWRETTTTTHVFPYDTTLADYQAVTPVAALAAWSFKQSMGIYDVVETHVSVWLDNVTHPPTAPGVVRLPKGNRDSALSDGEFDSANTLMDHINQVIADLRTLAKY